MNVEQVTVPSSEFPEPAFQPLDARVVKLWRVRRSITFAVLLGAVTVAAVSIILATGQWLPPIGGVECVSGIEFGFNVLVSPSRVSGMGVSHRWTRSSTRRGIWFRVHQLLPLPRLQHVDLHSGPLERSLGLASLLLHTAGTQHASIVIPGLDAREAVRLRDELVPLEETMAFDRQWSSHR